MKQVTREITNLFTSRKAGKISNTETDGTSLWLFGNKIAEYRDGDLWITNAGWQSNTTKERLNGLPGVSICQQKGVWYLNGEVWDGGWTCVSTGSKSNDDPFKSLVMVAKIGEVLTDNKTDANKWKQRMMKAGLGEGVSFPDDWDQLSEDEKERRLNGALDQLKK